MLKPTRGFLDRTNVPEFEENFEKIDAFRTHKYRQFGEKSIDLEPAALSDEEVEIEANGIFIKYPVDVDIRVNDLNAPKISALQFRYIGGYVHKIFITSERQNPKLELITGVNSELGYLPNTYKEFDAITGTATITVVNVLRWRCLPYAGKKIIIKNTGDTNNLGYVVYGYTGGKGRVIKRNINAGGIAPGNVEFLEFPTPYNEIYVQVVYITAATTYEINYAGTTQSGDYGDTKVEQMFKIVNETTSHTVNGDSFNSLPYRFAELHLVCTSLTGSSDTLDVKVQAYDSQTTDWHDIATFTQLTAAGTQHINISEGLGEEIRGVYTTGGTVTDCDFKLGVVLKK